MLYLVPSSFCLCLESNSLPFFIPFPVHFPCVYLSLSAFHLVFSAIDNSPYQKLPAAQSLPAVTVPLYFQKLLFVKHKSCELLKSSEAVCFASSDLLCIL